MPPKNNTILDEGNNKFFLFNETKMVKYDWMSLCSAKNSRNVKIQEFCNVKCDMIEREIVNESFKEAPPRIIYANKRSVEYYTEWNWVDWPKGPERDKMNKRFAIWSGGEDVVLGYLDIIPFIPSVMINISPDWKGQKITTARINDFHIVITNYMKEGWYSEWKYVLECGGNGDHLHAHIVAKMNRKGKGKCPDTGKNGHLGKGNHSSQLIKYADKTKGMKGMLKGVGINKKFLRTEEILQDTLDYLCESKKPDGHKNAAHRYLPILKEGVF